MISKQSLLNTAQQFAAKPKTPCSCQCVRNTHWIRVPTHKLSCSMYFRCIDSIGFGPAARQVPRSPELSRSWRRRACGPGWFSFPRSSKPRSSEVSDLSKSVGRGLRNTYRDVSALTRLWSIVGAYLGLFDTKITPHPWIPFFVIFKKSRGKDKIHKIIFL